MRRNGEAAPVQASLIRYHTPFKVVLIAGPPRTRIIKSATICSTSEKRRGPQAMWIFNFSLRIIDWFIPDAAKSERSELSLARNFVFTHLAGPLLSQPIGVFLFLPILLPG